MSEAQIDATGTAAMPAAPDRESIHPIWLRLMHWFNVIAVIILVMSGWRIYDGTNFMFGFHIPDANHGLNLTIGGWLGGALQWHFAFMWLLVINAVFYLGYNIATKRLWRQFLPVTIPGLWADARAFLKGKLSHDDIRHYNTIQKLAYLFAMIDILALIASGLVLWKNVQLPWLRILLGGYEGARVVHFTAMSLMVGFIIVHVLMALAVPRTIKAMIWGR